MRGLSSGEFESLLGGNQYHSYSRLTSRDLPAPDAQARTPAYYGFAKEFNSTRAIAPFAASLVPQRLQRINLRRSPHRRPASQHRHSHEQTRHHDQSNWIRRSHFEQKRPQHARQNNRQHNPRQHAARNQSESFAKDQIPHVFPFRANRRSNRQFTPPRRYRQRQHAVNSHQRQHAARHRKPNQQLHRKRARRQRIVANLFQRLWILDRRRRIDLMQHALDRNQHSPGIALRLDDEMLRKRLRLPQRQINLRHRLLRQIVRSSIRNLADNLRRRFVSPLNPKFPPDHIALRKILIRKRLIHHSHRRRLALVRRAKLPPRDHPQSHQIEIIFRHRAQRNRRLLALFRRRRLPLNFRRCRPIVPRQRHAPRKSRMLHARNRRDALQRVPVKTRPLVVPAHLSHAHRQNPPGVVARRHARNIDHRSNQ